MVKLGRTERFPHGKSRADDEGELRFAVGSKDGLVEVNFGTPVAWLSMPPDLALQFAQALTEHANMVKRT